VGDRGDVARDAAAEWAASAEAYIALQDEAGVGRGDAARRLLLDPVMLAQCGDVAGRDVLDLGCGEGRFCRMLAERGARVVGIDVTRRMVEVARERDRAQATNTRAESPRREHQPRSTRANSLRPKKEDTAAGSPRREHEPRSTRANSSRSEKEDTGAERPRRGHADVARGAYVWGSAERLPFTGAAFDLVVSYITLVDIPDYRAAIAECARVLRPGGRFVVANLSFVTAASPWVKDAQGRRLHRALDRYVEESAQVYEWSGIRITNFHRPLSHYMQAYLGAGLELRAFVEPVPADDSLRKDPYFEDWYRVPEFTVMAWEKRGAARGWSAR